jgi:hypothetical protein
MDFEIVMQRRGEFDFIHQHPTSVKPPSGDGRALTQLNRLVNMANNAI